MDAITDRSEEAHRYCVEKIFPRLGEATTVEDMEKLLKEKNVAARA